MNLAIDIGNTYIKTALFDKREIKKFNLTKSEEINTLIDYFATLQFNKAIISSVITAPSRLIAVLKKKAPLTILSHSTSLPIKIKYATPQKLGNDRLAAAIGAYMLLPGKDVLVIDAGTCITYDLVDKKGNYRGGAISPGIAMRFAALKQFTGKLPLVKPALKVALTGNSTERSIRSGVQIGAMAEMQGIIDRYSVKYPGIRVVITGGDHDFFVGGLKNSIFADPYLVLKGLNHIIEYNAGKK